MLNTIVGGGNTAGDKTNSLVPALMELTFQRQKQTINKYKINV